MESLAEFTFNIKNQKGRDNAVADALSCVVSKLNSEAVKSILDGVTIGTAGRTDTYDLMVAGADERIHKQVEETTVQAWTTHTCVNLHVMDWVAAYQEDSILKSCVGNGFAPIKYMMPNIFWETMPQQKRA